MHLFKAEQIRSFDFVTNGFASRYMLLEELVSPEVGGLFVQEEQAVLQYNRTLTPAINKTSLKTKVSVGVQADVVLKLSYQTGGLGVDVGYNFWARSKEKMRLLEQFESSRWAIKGDAQVYGDDFTALDTTSIIPVNATQSKATIQAGAGIGNANREFRNFNADNAGPAERTNIRLICSEPDRTTPLLPATGDNFEKAAGGSLEVPRPMDSSQEPILLQSCNIDKESAAVPGAISHKICTHINYTWQKKNSAIPFLGLGGELEIGQNTKKRGALSQGGVWLKGGVSF